MGSLDDRASEEVDAAMLEFTRGDLTKDAAQALVNTVNTVGVMGKGIALQFKRQYPGNFEAYRRACKAGEVRPGHMFVWRTGQIGQPEYVINFPTKRHWKSPSRLEDIEAGLRDLRRVIVEFGISSIALPPLGCGNGGLSWAQVRPVMERHLADLKGVSVRVYEPVGAPLAADMSTNQRKPGMTVRRAAMVAVFARYLKPGFTLGRLEAQKLLYFLQVVGAPYDRLRFEQAPFGPYCDSIRHVLNEVEGHFIRGYGDGDAPSAIQVLDDAVDAAERLLSSSDNALFRDAVDSVARLTAGFDDAFGLELLASVHWVATRTPVLARSPEEALRALADWSERKANRFDEWHVHAAWRRLAAEGLVQPIPSESHQRERPKPADSPLTVSGDLVASAM